MIIFTPNTVIKSADMNLNFAQVTALENLPMASVLRSTAQTIGNGAITAVSFDTQTYDTGDCWAIGDPTKFYAPSTGYYALFGHITYTANATGRRAILIDINGTTKDWSSLMPAGGAYTQAVNTYEEYYMTAGQYARIMAWQDSGGNLDTVASRVNGWFKRVQ